MLIYFTPFDTLIIAIFCLEFYEILTGLNPKTSVFTIRFQNKVFLRNTFPIVASSSMLSHFKESTQYCQWLITLNDINDAHEFAYAKCALRVYK